MTSIGTRIVWTTPSFILCPCCMSSTFKSISPRDHSKNTLIACDVMFFLARTSRPASQQSMPQFTKKNKKSAINYPLEAGSARRRSPSTDTKTICALCVNTITQHTLQSHHTHTHTHTHTQHTAATVRNWRRTPCCKH